MFDWLLIARNLPWIVGMAVVLASPSAAVWFGARHGLRRTLYLATPEARAGLYFGLALVCLGLSLHARFLAETLLWLAVLLWLASRAPLAWRARREAQAASYAPHEPTHISRRPETLGQLQRVASWVADVELVWLLALAPFLLFPARVTPWLLPLLLVPWVARRVAWGHWTARTVMDGPILLLLLMLPISLRVSVDLQRSLPKLYGLLLGVAVFFGVVNYARTPARAFRAGLAISLGGLAAALISFVGTHWPDTNGLLPKAWRQLPALLTKMGGSLSGGFNPNEVAGSLCFFVPLLASLLLDYVATPGARPMRSTHGLSTLRHVPAWLLPLLWALGLLLMVSMLILSQSRSAMVGILGAWAVFAAFRPRWRRPALFATLIFAVLAWRFLGSREIVRVILEMGAERNVRVRFEIWQSALSMIRDYPFTGVGLNTFSLIANRLYPVLSVSPQKVLQWTHTHNVFLQVAVDVGIPGLVAYLALLVDSALAFWVAYRNPRLAELRTMGVGLLCSLVAYHLYGLADCLTLGAKPGLALWAILGLLAALANLPTGQSVSEQASSPLR